MEKKDVKIFEFEGNKITFEFENGQKMVNATQMAKVFNKKMNNFLRTKNTKAFIKILEESRNAKKRFGSPYKALRVVKGGNRKDLQGTWMSERLALKFAAWLSPAFEVWVYHIIHEVLTNDEDIVKLNKKNYEWHLQKITNGIEGIRNLLDTIPGQAENRKRIS